jgi:hypothetical protein
MDRDVTTILSFPTASPSLTALYTAGAVTMETPAFPQTVSHLTEICSSLERVLAEKYRLFV